jgi:hypothetical protein
LVAGLTPVHDALAWTIDDPSRIVLSVYARHGQRWAINAGRCWTAERTEGTCIKVVSAATESELITKLDEIEAAQ